MAFEPLDWEITRSTGNIRYIGADHDGTAGSNGRTTPTYATVIEFHRALQDFADDASSSGDDQLDITDDNPSDRSTDNIITLLGSYNIDDAASEHLYDGSIIQSSGDVIYDGIVNFGNAPTIQVVQNGLVIADDWWNNDTQGNSLGLNSDPAGGISHRFMVKVRTGGGDTDGRRLLGLSRDYGFTYAEFAISATSRGNNVLALSRSTDLNNATASGTVAGYDSSALTEGYVALDVDNNGADENYYIQWDLGSRTAINDLYEKVKYITRDGTAETLFGLNGLLFRGVTHELSLSGTNSGTFNAFEPVSWSSGTGQMLAIDNTQASSATKMYIQLLTGSAPAGSTLITGQNSSATATTSGTATERTVESTSAPGLGVSTGSAIIGAYGVGVTPGDLGPNDKVFDLTNTQITPPNNVTFTVSGLITGEDRVLVGPSSGGTTLNTAQLTSATAVSAGTVPSTFTVSTTIPSDTPSAGKIRVEDDSGFYVLVEYTGFSGSDFTGCTGSFTNASASGKNVFISYIDEDADAIAIAATALSASTQYVIETVGTTDFTLIGAASNTVGVVFTATGAGTGTGTAKPYVTTATFTAVYNADRDLVVKVRDGGTSPIKEFITGATLGTNGGSVAAIRTSDA
jgi:hypothetical protein